METREERQWPSLQGGPTVFQPSGLVVSGPDDVSFTPEKSRFAAGLLRLPVRCLQNWLAEEGAYGVRFLFAPVFAAGGVIAYFSLGWEVSWLRLVLLALLFGALAYLCRRSRVASLGFMFMVIAVAGALCAKAETARLATVMLGNETTTFLTGRIVTLDETDYGYRVVLDVVASERPALSDAISRVQLSARKLPDGLAVGDGVKGLARLRPPSGPVLPGAYDFSFHSYFRGIGAQGFFMGAPEKAAVPLPDSVFVLMQMYVAQLRQAMTERIHAAIGGEAGAVASALITGQRGGITNETNDALRHAGLSHILSISGLHMAMVTGMVLVVARALTGLFPVFSSRHAPKKIAAVIALLAAAFYLMLSGSDVAAQRSFVMVAVMLIAVLCDRAAITMRNLAIAAFITILVVPHEILGPSFQMSFAATAVLIAAFQWWSRRQSKRNDRQDHQSGILHRFLLAPLAGTIASSLLAGTASGIFSAFHFNNTAPLGMLSNALAFPVMSFLVMPFALLAAVMMPLHLEWLPLKIMGGGVTVVQKIAYWVASLSPDFNPGAFPSSALAAFSIALVLLVFLRSPLRYGAFAAILAGGLICAFAPRPLALISEDGRLVAILGEGGRFAVNIARPPARTLSNWRAAFRVDEVLPPQDQDNEKDAAMAAFRCESALFCHVRLANSKTLTIAKSPQAKEQACQNGDIVFLNYSGDDTPCAHGLTISRKQLALSGMAAIYPAAGPVGADVVWAAGSPVRPWNAQRRFGQTARGMP